MTSGYSLTDHEHEKLLQAISKNLNRRAGKADEASCATTKMPHDLRT